MRLLNIPSRAEVAPEPAALVSMGILGRLRTAWPMPGVLGHWVTKGFWAVTDQGLFAVSNFLLNVMLARWLSPKEYGAFTVAFSVFLLLGTCHSTFLMEPMMVFGPARYAGRFSQYMGVLMAGHWALVTAGGVLLALTGVVISLLGSSALLPALVGFALAGPFTLLMWLLRRACYVRLEPHLAALASFVYLLLTIAGLYVLYQRGWLSAASALLLVGFVGLVISAWLVLRIRIDLTWAATRGMAHEVLRAHWDYGRWVTAAMVLTWLPGNIYYLLLPVWKGLDASAGLKAMINLTMPIRNAHLALALLLLPALVRTRGTVGFGRLTHVAVVLFSVASVAYWVPVVLFHRPLVAWLYGGHYEAPVEGLWLLGVFIVTGGAVDILGGALRAFERPDLVFRANVLAAGAALTLGLWATASWGIVGAGAGLALSSIVRLVPMWRYYRVCREASDVKRNVDALGVTDGG